MRLVQGQAERKRITLSTGLGSRTGSVLADRRAVKQMLVNLLSNAVKFTPPGGRIDVEVAVASGARRIGVRDTGIGIASEDIEAALLPFGQGRQPVEVPLEGSGLGLPIMKSLIEMHGGRLEIASCLHGTAAVLIFPASRLLPVGETTSAA